MKSLVTGGAGFIGSHLVELLLAQGDEVVVVDDLSTGTLENLWEVRDNPRLTIDVCRVEEMNPLTLADLYRSSDRVFHLASVVGVSLYVENPVRTIEAIVESTSAMLKAAEQNPDIPLVVTSTSEVYGRGAKIPMHEDDDLVYGPTSKSRWSYAMAKGLDEQLALGYRAMGVDVRNVRLFNSVGPRQLSAYGMVMAIFVKQALAGDPITVHETGQQTRTFCHVLDTVEALIRVSETPEWSVPVMNIGGDQEWTMNELAQEVKQVLGSDSEIVRVPYSDVYGDGFEDTMRRCPDVSIAREVIDFEQTRTVLDMIEDIAEWHRGSV